MGTLVGYGGLNRDYLVIEGVYEGYVKMIQGTNTAP